MSEAFIEVGKYVEPHSGKSIQEVVREACKLARTENTVVAFQFNETLVEVRPDSEERTVIERWHQMFGFQR